MSNISTALALIGALAVCNSAWCAEQAVDPARAAVEADALAASGESAAAIETLTRAVGILRRNAGLYDRRQYLLLSQLTDLQSLQGDVDAAVTSLGYMEQVSERTHGRQSVEHALSLSKIAAWQCRLGRFDSGSTAQRYVEIELTVLADGSVDGERVVTREAGKSAADETLEALRVARFRQQFK